MQWQIHFDFVIGASVAMSVLRNQKSEKEGQRVEEEGMYWCIQWRKTLLNRNGYYFYDEIFL